MDVFSEIEIEALIEETLALEQADNTIEPDSAALEIGTEALAAFLGEAQSFDPFAAEWLDGAADITQIIDSDAADWLTAFIDGDIESDITTTDKPQVNYTEGDDEVITTGTINTSWDSIDVMNFMDSANSIWMADLMSTLNGAVDTSGPGDDAPAVGAPVDEVVVTGTITHNGQDYDVPFGFEIMDVNNPNNPYMINPSTGEILITPWYLEQLQTDQENYDWVGFWTTLIAIAGGSIASVGGVVGQIAGIIGASAGLAGGAD